MELIEIKRKMTQDPTICLQNPTGIARKMAGNQGPREKATEKMSVVEK